MKAFQQFMAALRQLGVNIPARWIVAIVLLVPLLIAAFLFIHPRWTEWRSKRKAQAPELDRGTSLPPPSQLASFRLRRAWNRFLRGLPPVYRRSILNFDQFVVLGSEGSGKTRLVDTYTDWKRQTKQFVGTHTYDPELQVYLGSNAVVTEIPAAVLHDTSEKCRTALTNLWRPLYRRRSVVVIVALDPIRLGKETPDSIDDLAETLRGKINLLSRIRRGPVEIRVALTHLAEIEGHREYAAFCREQGISTRIPTRLRGDDAKIGAQLAQWFDAARGHLPRALTTVSAADYKRTVLFLQKAPEIVPPVARFLECLFAHEALSPDPICGGVYLTSETPGPTNPFASSIASVAGPDPRRNHLIAAVAVAASIVVYLGAAYKQQSSRWSLAAHAMDEYRPSTYGTEGEVQRRGAISDFTYRSTGWMQTHPNFFSGARGKMRSRMSEAIREELLVPRLKDVAERGIVQEGGIPLQTRRSLYYLALIHSDRSDGIHILAPGREEVWTLMTGLQGDLIRDYLENTDVAYRKAIPFELGEREVDSRDSAIYWLGFLRSIAETIAAGVVGPDDLKAFQARATQLSDNLERFDHDDITRAILGELDQAAGIGQEGSAAVHLSDAYSPKYADFLQSIVQSDVYTQRERFKSILRIVRASQIEATDTPLLRNLVERLTLLETPLGDAAANTEAEVRLKVADQEFVFDTKKWREMIRNSEVSEQMGRFMRYGEERSVFFTTDMDSELRPIVWNPTNDGSSIFVGRATIEGRYTRAAFDKHVREVVKKLDGTLDGAHVPDAQKKQLNDFVRDQVRRYATEYRAQVVRFYQSFALRTPSQEALRVALSQMVSDNSSFNDYLVAIDQNTHLEPDSPLLEPMNDALADFGSFHNVVNATSGAPELAKYRAIIGQLLADLGPAETGAAIPDAPAGAQTGTLEKELTPSGRIVLANLRGEKGSYAGLVSQWLQSIKLPEDQQRPFLAPLGQLTVLGRDDLQRVIQRVWYSDVLPDVQRIVGQFPFNLDSKEDATPHDLTELFHPQTGRFFDLFRRYIEPVSEFPDGGSFRERRSIGDQLKLPTDMYPIINSVAALSARLWDSTGKPSLIDFRVASVPFEHGLNPHAAVTLVYLNLADSSVFDFNQKPGLTSVHIDWTKETNSQVGVQLTDLDTKENAFPEPVVVEGSCWSFLHLLRHATATPVKQPAGALLYTWAIKHKPDGAESTNARFVVVGDPWAYFTLSKVVKVPPVHLAAVN